MQTFLTVVLLPRRKRDKVQGTLKLTATKVLVYFQTNFPMGVVYFFFENI
jgi:hypothetical protein